MDRQYFVILCVMVAAIWDIKCKRIPNLITIPLAIIGLSLGVYEKVLTYLPGLIVNFIIAGAVFGHGYVMKYIGAGDIKLILAVACWCGTRSYVSFIIFVLLWGAGFAVTNIIKENHLLQNLSEVKNISMYGFIDRIRMRSGHKLAYGVCVLLGYLTAVLI